MRRSEVKKALTAYEPLIKKVLLEQELKPKEDHYQRLRQGLRGQLTVLMREFDSWSLFRKAYRNPYLTKYLRAQCVLLLRSADDQWRQQVLTGQVRNPHPDLVHQLQLTMILLPLWSSLRGKERRFLLQLFTGMEQQQMGHRSRQIYREQLRLDLAKLWSPE